MTDTDPETPTLTARERWLYRLALTLMAIFTLLGVYILYYPTEFLIAVFAILALLTIVVGVIAGLVAIYSS